MSSGSTQQRLSSLAGRRQEVERELTELADSRGQSANSALGDLETALNGELDKIDQQVRQLREYMDRVEQSPEL